MVGEKKKLKKTPNSGDAKAFKELKKMTKLLEEIRFILDSIWREKLP